MANFRGVICEDVRFCAFQGPKIETLGTRLSSDGQTWATRFTLPALPVEDESHSRTKHTKS
jgi:hypothetical protein